LDVRHVTSGDAQPERVTLDRSAINELRVGPEATVVISLIVTVAGDLLPITVVSAIAGLSLLCALPLGWPPFAIR
jgi:hypothetical protein